MRVLAVFVVALLLLSCGGGTTSSSSNLSVSSFGWHFQGRNCLACHNVDLSKNLRQLIIGGTVYKNFNVSNPDDPNQVCKTKLAIWLTVGPCVGGNTVVDTTNSTYLNNISNTRGYSGSGNIFILRRGGITDIPKGSYTVCLLAYDSKTKNWILIAQSKNNSHSFDIGINNYDPRNNPVDSLNRYSCNACHTYPNPKANAPGRIYANLNKFYCK